MTDGIGLSAARQAEIRSAFEREEYRRLFAAVRERLERAGSTTVRSVSLRGLTPEERHAIAELHGWARIPEGKVRVSIEQLDTALRESRLRVGVVQVVEVLGGPIVDRRAESEAAARDRRLMWQEGRAHPAIQARPELQEWLADLEAQGILKRVARRAQVGERELLADALDIVARLPSVAGAPLSVLATEATGDAHALDIGKPLAALVLRAVARLAGWPGVPSSATQRRALWAAVGVHCDALSCHVLVHGLRPIGDQRLPRHLRECAMVGEPARLTLRELSTCSLSVPDGTAIFVCENPAVVAVAADQVGSRCAPLVCVEGVPSAAAWELLDALVASGAQIRFHADFDWGGLRIGNLLVERLGAKPWRFCLPDYEVALDSNLPEHALSGVSIDAAWDPGLAGAMQGAGRAVSEELLVGRLLTDLREDAPPK